MARSRPGAVQRLVVGVRGVGRVHDRRAAEVKGPSLVAQVAKRRERGERAQADRVVEGGLAGRGRRLGQGRAAGKAGGGQDRPVRHGASSAGPNAAGARAKGWR